MRQVLPEELERRSYAIAPPGGSPLRETVSVALLEALADPEWARLLRRYVG